MIIGAGKIKVVDGALQFLTSKEVISYINYKGKLLAAKTG